MYKPYDKLLDKIAYCLGLVILICGITALFLINKYNIDVINSYGETPLHYACKLFNIGHRLGIIEYIIW